MSELRGFTIDSSPPGITGYWLSADAGERCSVCFRKDRVLYLDFGRDQMRTCEECATALRELLNDALEDLR